MSFVVRTSIGRDAEECLLKALCSLGFTAITTEEDKRVPWTVRATEVLGREDIRGVDFFLTLPVCISENGNRRNQVFIIPLQLTMFVVDDKATSARAWLKRDKQKAAHRAGKICLFIPNQSLQDKNSNLAMRLFDNAAARNATALATLWLLLLQTLRGFIKNRQKRFEKEHTSVEVLTPPNLAKILQESSLIAS